MNDDETPTSFDALANEHNLSPRLRDVCRIFFKAGLAMGRRQAAASIAAAAGREPVGRRPGEQPGTVR